MGIIPSIQVSWYFHVPPDFRQELTAQPTHATSDMAYALSRLGPERLSHSAYRMASLFPSQEMVGSGYPGPVLGSDFPVEPPNPFHGMFAAVTRLNPATGTSPSGEGGWYPQEALTVEQALHGFTKNAAYGWFQEDRAGAIEVGRWADFIVVDKNIWEDVSGRSLKNLTVRETWMGGRKVYPRQDFQVKGGPKASFKEAIMAVQTSLAQLFKRIMGGTDQEL